MNFLLILCSDSLDELPWTKQSSAMHLSVNENPCTGLGGVENDSSERLEKPRD